MAKWLSDLSKYIIFIISFMLFNQHDGYNYSTLNLLNKDTKNLSDISIRSSKKINFLSTFSPFPDSFPHALTVTTGLTHTCVLLEDQTVMCWGSNEFGQLGNGNNLSTGFPVSVQGLNGVVSISAGAYHTCALLNSGKVLCWGQNWMGQLGDGTYNNNNLPVEVNNLSSGVKSISAGFFHNCVITEDGNVKCWGQNDSGQLGDNTNENRNIPVLVLGESEDAKTISAGLFHSCLTTITGKARCWGYNSGGQLGDGTLTSRFTPVSVVGLESDTLSIKAGMFHTCAITASGAMKCWGHNETGQLGLGTSEDHSFPVDVTNINEKITEISLSGESTCALTLSGGIKCWGWNNYGTVGDGTVGICKYEPTDVMGLSSGVISISSTKTHTCAVNKNGGVKCWGYDNLGQLGDGAVSASLEPRKSAMLYPINEITLGGGPSPDEGGFSCQISVEGKAQCIGINDYGQLGNGNSTSSWTPVNVEGSNEKVIQISSGSYHSCLLSASGGVKCWGVNTYGELGDGTLDLHNSPVDVIGLTSQIKSIKVSEDNSCALTNIGTVKCWGDNTYGQLGNGTTTNSSVPVDVSGLENVSEITMGGKHACALTQTGEVKCWGENFYGQLGDGTIGDYSITPIIVDGLTNDVASISAGYTHTCALLNNGAVKCWGNNSLGQLGDGTNENKPSPVSVSGISDVSILTAGSSLTCAVTKSGQVSCWGGSPFPLLANDIGTIYQAPKKIEGIPNNIKEIAISGRNICALTSDNHVYCWGDNSARQLGDGFPLWQATAVDVLGIGNPVLKIFIPIIKR